MVSQLDTQSAELAAVIDSADEQPDLQTGKLLRNRNFLFLWLGEMVSLLGDQFYLIALPWLVLQLTGDGLAVGTVLAVAAIPRAAFMLVGGAVTDRFSPLSVMISSNGLRLALVGLLAALVLTGQVQLWMLYGFALAFGLADAFFYPAQTSIVPQLVSKDRLQTANAFVQGTSQISMFAGPLLAGVLIAIFSAGATIDGETVPDLTGIGLAFAFDAVTFLASIATLSLIRPPQSHTPGSDQGVLADIREGLGMIWASTTMRPLFVMIAASQFLIIGPVLVGIPVLADTRFPEGAAAYGIIMSAFAGGSLVGIALAGLLPAPAPRAVGPLILVAYSIVGFGTALFGFLEVTVTAAVVTAVIGAGQGYTIILFMTWLQHRTPEAMLGRVMSILMFASAGLEPVSAALSGVLVDWNVSALFFAAGVLMGVLVLATGFSPAVRRMGLAEDIGFDLRASDVLNETHV